MRRGPLASRLFPALPFVVLAGAFLAGGPAGCAARAERSGLELPPTTGGDLAVEIRYPPAGAALTASDSTFVFGRVTGAPGAEVTLTVNGESVPVHPEGGWIAFLPVRPDSFAFQVRAEAGGRVAEAERTVWVPRPLYAVGSDTLPYRPGTIEPLGPLEVYAGDTISVSVVAAPGLQVRARLGDEAVRLLPQPAREVNRGRQVWGSEDQVEGFRPAIWIQAADAARGRRPGPWLRYAGDVFAQLGGGLTDSLTLEFADGQGEPLVVPIAGVSYLDPTRVGVAALHDDTAGTGHTDGRVVARTGPGLGYELLLPNGTVAATGRRAGDWREIVLGPGTRAWVPLAETLPIEAPRPRDVIAVVRTRVRDGWSEVVLPLQVALPFAVEQELDPVRYAIRVYGLLSNVDWIETTIADPLIRSVRWSEPADGVFRLDVDLAGDRAWGWRSYREGTHLVIGFRHPPATGGGLFRSPLHGVRVVVDPGHSPEPGAVGPTGLEERDANLAIALELAGILEERGAEVVLTRATPDSGLGLYDRTRLAVDAGGQIFVSIHNNALPDGVNPFANNGTSVLYYHPQSEPLARAIQAELLPRTGLDDHGVWYQNLAVARMTEMPAVLVEAAFMMLPDQEARLRTGAFQRRIAEGLAEGIERFLEESAGG